MRSLFLIGILSIAGCGVTTPVDTTDYRAIASASFALAILTPDEGGGVTPDPKPDQCDCGGKGFIIHGDGHRTPCPCGPNCQCGSGDSGDVGEAPNTQEVSAEVAPRRQRVIAFGAKWCVPCVATDPYYEHLKAAGWKVGPEESNHFQRVDFDENPELARKYSVDRIPTYIVIVDEKVVYRHIGPARDAFHLGDIYHMGDK